MAVAAGEVQRISERLLGRIISGRYGSGLRLPSEVDLAAEFECGRSTIREALRHLTDLGVVRSRRGSGAMVLDFRREGTPALLPAYVLAGQFDLPVATLARELLRIRSMLAGEAVRLAARYAAPSALVEPRRLLAHARTLERDKLGHAMNEVALFRSIVQASGIWPAVWLANVYWAPVRELHSHLAPLLSGPPSHYQRTMTAVLDRIEQRDEAAATDLIHRFFERVDLELLGQLEQTLNDQTSSSSQPPAAPRPTLPRAPKARTKPRTPRKVGSP
jgi:DNA-binding FadR family transcriptional regulator